MTAITTGIHIDRLAATEYFEAADPAHSRRMQFGVWVHQPDFPGRYDANQLIDCRCSADDVPALLEEVEALYAPTTLPYRKIEGHDEPTLAALQPILEDKGWKLTLIEMMTFDAPPLRPINPRVRIEAVDSATSKDWRYVERVSGRSEHAIECQAAQDARLGGQALVAYLHGEPVGASGWFIVDGVVRFRRVGVIPVARGRRVATTLIRHVQNLPIVRQQETLTIFVNRDGPRLLYQDLGFVTRGVMWEFLRTLPAPDQGTPA